MIEPSKPDLTSIKNRREWECESCCCYEICCGVGAWLSSCLSLVLHEPVVNTASTDNQEHALGDFANGEKKHPNVLLH
jgi:hypothetical protein